MPPEYTKIDAVDPFSTSQNPSCYLVHGKKFQIITAQADSKILDVRVALTQAEYKRLREKRKHRHLSEFESITPFDVEAEHADFNKFIDEMTARRNSSKKNVISRFYKFRFSDYFWDYKKLKEMQTFMLKAKEKLLDATIDLHDLRNNPRSLLPENSDEIDIKTQNVNALILEKLIERINAFQKKIAENDCDIELTHELKLQQIRKNVENECRKFRRKIQDLINKGATEQDVEALFQNKKLGNFIAKCEFHLVDGLDKIVRDMDGNAYWDLWDLHPARKVYSRIKRGENIRASLAGAQTIAERPVSPEMMEYLESGNKEDKDNKAFWVSLAPYVDRDFSLPEIEDICNILGPDTISEENKIQSPSIAWNLRILVTSFVWEPIPIIIRLASTAVFTIPAIATYALEKGLNTFYSKNAGSKVAEWRNRFIEKPNFIIGRWCQNLSRTLVLKKQRGEEALKLNPDLSDQLSVEFIIQNNITVPEEQKRQAFLRRLNSPINQMHVLAEENFSPSKWGKELTELVTSILVFPFRLGSELREFLVKKESAKEVYTRLRDKTVKRTQDDVSKAQMEWEALQPKNISSQDVNEVGEVSLDNTSKTSVETAMASINSEQDADNKKGEPSDLEKLCQEVQRMATAAQPNQTTDFQSFFHVGHTFIRVLADKLVNNFLCESPGVSTFAAGAAVGTLGLSLFPAIVSSLKLVALLEKAQIFPELLSKNIMYQSLSEGSAEKVFAGFLEYKAIVLAADGAKAVINGDLGIFKNIFQNPETLAFGFICSTAVGVALSSIYETSSLSLWEDAFGIEDVQGPFIFMVNSLLDQEHHAKRSTTGPNLAPYAVLGLKSLMFIKSLTDGKKKRNYKNVVENFFATWREKGLETPLETMLKSDEGMEFLIFWEKFTKQDSIELQNFVKKFDERIKAAREQSAQIEEKKPANDVSNSELIVAHVVEEPKNQEELETQKEESSKESLDIQKAYKELMDALNWIETNIDALNFEKNNTFFNSDPYKFYDHLHHLFENYNNLADWDAQINGETFLKDFYSEYCYEGSNNFMRAVVWLGNIVGITPLYRNIKLGLLGHSPSMEEQYLRSRAKDIAIPGEIVATTGRILHATLRFVDQLLVGAFAAPFAVVLGTFAGVEKVIRAGTGIGGQSIFARGLKLIINGLCDTFKLHNISSGRQSAYAETANKAATTHNLPRTLNDVIRKATDVKRSVNITTPCDKKMALKEAVKGLWFKSRRVNATNELERLAHLQKTVQNPQKEAANKDVESASLLTEKEQHIDTDVVVTAGFFGKDPTRARENALRRLPSSIREQAKEVYPAAPQIRGG